MGRGVSCKKCPQSNVHKSVIKISRNTKSMIASFSMYIIIIIKVLITLKTAVHVLLYIIEIMFKLTRNLVKGKDISAMLSPSRDHP